jgi:hypothetical protein
MISFLSSNKFSRKLKLGLVGIGVSEEVAVSSDLAIKPKLANKSSPESTRCSLITSAESSTILVSFLTALFRLDSLDIIGFLGLIFSGEDLEVLFSDIILEILERFGITLLGDDPDTGLEMVLGKDKTGL